MTSGINEVSLERFPVDWVTNVTLIVYLYTGIHCEPFVVYTYTRSNNQYLEIYIVAETDSESFEPYATTESNNLSLAGCVAVGVNH